MRLKLCAQEESSSVGMKLYSVYAYICVLGAGFSMFEKIKEVYISYHIRCI